MQCRNRTDFSSSSDVAVLFCLNGEEGGSSAVTLACQPAILGLASKH